MNEVLSDLTLIVPTFNRHASLMKLLQYYAPLPVNLIIVDGSVEAFDTSGYDDCTCSLRYFHMPVSYEQRMTFAGNLCDTEFVMISGDDEYYLRDGLINALNKLRNNVSLSAVAGRCAAFVYNEQGLRLGTFYNFLKDYNNNHQLSSARVQQVIDCFPIISGFFYSVCRASAFKAATQVAFRYKFTCPFVQEVLFSLSLFIQGGVRTTPELLWLRNLQATPVNDAQWQRKLDFSVWYSDPKYAAEVALMLSCVTDFYGLFLTEGEPEFSMSDFFIALIDFDRQLSAGLIEADKAYDFPLSVFLILSRQRGLSVDEACLREVERIELASIIASNETTQIKSRLTTW